MTYEIITYSLAPILAYVSSFSLYRLKIIRRALHVRLWNILLLISFLISAGFGMLVLFRLEYGIEIPSSGTLNFWHVEIGLALFVISALHIHTYWKSFQKIVLS
ncbi:hypothetical protein [Methanobacterium sp. ACI-7]|uniref:hypothetical protein n=1 Tax=unclassified Methanobacterium TaxID=2627676 RepID=UPI0039C2157F